MGHPREAVDAIARLHDTPFCGRIISVHLLRQNDFDVFHGMPISRPMELGPQELVQMKHPFDHLQTHNFGDPNPLVPQTIPPMDFGMYPDESLATDDLRMKLKRGGNRGMTTRGGPALHRGGPMDKRGRGRGNFAAGNVGSVSDATSNVEPARGATGNVGAARGAASNVGAARGAASNVGASINVGAASNVGAVGNVGTVGNVGLARGAASIVGPARGTDGNVGPARGATSNVGAGIGVATNVGPAGDAARNVGSARGAASNVGPARVAASNIGPVKGATSIVGPARDAASNIGIGRGTTTNLGPARGAISIVGPARGAASNVLPARVATSNIGPVRGATTIVGPARDAAINVGVARVAASYVGPARGATSNVGPARGAASNIGIGRATTSNIGPARGAASNVGTGRGTTSNVGSARGAASSVAAGRGAAINVGAGRGAAVNVSPARAAAANVSSARDISSSAGPASGVASNDGPSRGAASNVVPSRSAASNVAPSRGAASNDWPSRGAASNVGHTRGGACNVGPVRGDASNVGSARGTASNDMPSSAGAITFRSARSAASTFGAARGAASNFGSASSDSDHVEPSRGVSSSTTGRDVINFGTVRDSVSSVETDRSTVSNIEVTRCAASKVGAVPSAASNVEANRSAVNNFGLARYAASNDAPARSTASYFEPSRGTPSIVGRSKNTSNDATTSSNVGAVWETPTNIETSVSSSSSVLTGHVNLPADQRAANSPKIVSSSMIKRDNSISTTFTPKNVYRYETGNKIENFPTDYCVNTPVQLVSSGNLVKDNANESGFPVASGSVWRSGHSGSDHKNDGSADPSVIERLFELSKQSSASRNMQKYDWSETNQRSVDRKFGRDDKYSSRESMHKGSASPMSGYTVRPDHDISSGSWKRGRSDGGNISNDSRHDIESDSKRMCRETLPFGDSQSQNLPKLSSADSATFLNRPPPSLGYDEAGSRYGSNNWQNAKTANNQTSADDKWAAKQFATPPPPITGNMPTTQINTSVPPPIANVVKPLSGPFDSNKGPLTRDYGHKSINEPLTKPPLVPPFAEITSTDNNPYLRSVSKERSSLVPSSNSSSQEQAVGFNNPSDRQNIGYINPVDVVDDKPISQKTFPDHQNKSSDIASKPLYGQGNASRYDPDHFGQRESSRSNLGMENVASHDRNNMSMSLHRYGNAPNQGTSGAFNRGAGSTPSYQGSGRNDQSLYRRDAGGNYDNHNNRIESASGSFGDGNHSRSDNDLNSFSRGAGPLDSRNSLSGGGYGYDRLATSSSYREEYNPFLNPEGTHGRSSLFSASRSSKLIINNVCVDWVIFYLFLVH